MGLSVHVGHFDGFSELYGYVRDLRRKASTLLGSKGTGAKLGLCLDLNTL